MSEETTPMEATEPVAAVGEPITVRELATVLGAVEAQHAAVLEHSEADAIHEAMEAKGAIVTPTPEGQLIPIELTGIDLRIEMRVPSQVANCWQHTQTLIARLREKFGSDVILEELSQVLSGTVEKVTVSRPQPVVAPVQQQAPRQPQPVSIPQTANDLGSYQIQASCPWTGQSLKMIDPRSIYEVISNPVKAAILTAQDLQMMNAYYREWYARQQQAVPVSVATQDNLPFS